MSTKSSRGSSLLEMLVVLLVISVLGAGSVLATRALLWKPALGRQSREALATLSAVDQRALSTGREIQVELDAATQTIWEIHQSGPEGETRTPLLRFTSGVRIAHAAFGVGGKSSRRSVFYGTGVASPGTVTFADSTGETCTITQSIRGNRHLECRTS